MNPSEAPGKPLPGRPVRPRIVLMAKTLSEWRIEAFQGFPPLLSAAIEALIDVADPGKGVSGLQQRALDAPRSCHSFVADS